MTSAALRAQMEHLVGQAGAGSVPSGILYWWGGPALPDGSNAAPPLVPPQWLGCYGALRHAALLPERMPAPPALSARLRRQAQDGPFPLAVAHFDYARPRAEVVAAFTRGAAVGRPLRQPPSCLAECIEPGVAFFASLLLPDQWGRAAPEVRARVFQIVLDRRWWLRSSGLPLPDALTLDSGNGPQPVRFGQRVTCSAGSRAEVVLELRARFGTQWLSARCRVAIGTQAAAPPPDQIWPLAGAGHVRGEACVYRAPVAATARRYVLMSEGFPGGYPPSYLYDNLNQHRLLERLRRHGHDVVVVSYAQGMRPMQDNAEVMIAAIRRAGQDGRGHTVGGVSMGGLIARYALAAMEQRGIPHHTAIYLSIDAPHRGSRTSVSNQWFAHFFRDSVPQMDSLVALLDSPANQQFLPQWYHDGQVLESELRTRFVSELAALGDYPRQLRRYAVASGRGDGVANMPPSTIMLAWRDSPFVSAQLCSQPADGQRGVIAQGASYRAVSGVPDTLAMHSAVSWEAVPGSLASYNQLLAGLSGVLGCGQVTLPAATACVVPTVSALDLDLDPLAPIPPADSQAGPFHDYLCADDNLPHIATTAAMADWLFARITRNPC